MLLTVVYLPDVWGFLFSEKREFVSLLEYYVDETGPFPKECPVWYSDVDLSAVGEASTRSCVFARFKIVLLEAILIHQEVAVQCAVQRFLSMPAPYRMKLCRST
jgi:hypothetical protein